MVSRSPRSVQSLCGSAVTWHLVFLFLALSPSSIAPHWSSSIRAFVPAGQPPGLRSPAFLMMTVSSSVNLSSMLHFIRMTSQSDLGPSSWRCRLITTLDVKGGLYRCAGSSRSSGCALNVTVPSHGKSKQVYPKQVIKPWKQGALFLLA